MQQNYIYTISHHCLEFFIVTNCGCDPIIIISYGTLIMLVCFIIFHFNAVHTRRDD
jgi:hypothetical protein